MINATRAAIALLLGAVLAMGCKNGSSGSTGSGSGGGSSGGGGQGTSSGPGGGGAAATKFGGVSVLQQRVGNTYSGVFSAVFYEAEGLPATCTTTDVGPCSVVDCTYPTSHDPTPVTNRSGGKVTVQGTIDPQTLLPNADATYTPAVTGQLWNEGASLDLDVAGDEAPAASATLTGVAILALTSPAFGSTALDVDRGHDLHVAWTGGSAGDATVQLTRVAESGGTSHSVAVTCAFPAGAGAGTVPAAALSTIPAGPDGAIAFFNRDQDIQRIGEWSITFAALSSNVATTAIFH